MEVKCPICQVDTVLKDGDYHCPSCERDWYEYISEGESCLMSRRRRVSLTKLPEEGDNINDVIKPFKP